MQETHKEAETTIEIKKKKEEEATSGHQNGEARETNGKEGETNGKEEINGEKAKERDEDEANENNHPEKEATKRKADESGDVSTKSIPVSAEKVAKLKEGDEEKQATEDTST